MAVIGAGSIATSTTLAWNTEHDNYHNRLAKEDKTQQASFSFASTSIDPAVWQAWKTTIGKRCSCEGSSSGLSAGVLSRLSNIRKRRNTFKMMEDQAEHETLESRYSVDWSNPIGEGSFGSVYAAKDRKTGERVAVKKISKRATDDVSFQREMEALLHIRKCGGHPHICGLRSNYDQGDFYYLVLDMVSGGEMFDHLCTHGAYSEADAARLIREVASALAFLHGLNCVHGDIKPENRKYLD
jgi:aminoglycoside phosphotransferase